MRMGLVELPKLYPIIDKTTLGRRGISVGAFARELRDAGVRLVQYRDKVGEPQQILRAAAEIAGVFAGIDARLILNDRADLAVLAGWGVHVGQGDLSVADARRVIGEGKIVGISTHTDAQVKVADVSVTLPPMSENPDMGHPDSLMRPFGSGADYVAVGPVFATSTKADAEPMMGLEGVRRARALTGKPLVAIGGITLENARSVIEAGADSVAVISGLFVPGRTVRDVARDFLEVLR